MFSCDFLKIVLISQATQTIGVSPKSKIQIAVRTGEDLLVFQHGIPNKRDQQAYCYQSSISKTKQFCQEARRVAQRTSRTVASNKSAASHSTGVLSYHP